MTRGAAFRPEAVLAALGVWTGIHVMIALLHLDDLTASVPSLVALALTLVGTAVAVAPLSRRFRTALPLPLAVVLGCVPPLVALHVVPVVPTAVVTGFANWWPGAVGPLLAALGMRRRGAVAAASALAATGVLWVLLEARPISHERAVLAALTLAAPMLLWTVGGVVVRRLLERSARSVAELADVEATAREREEDALARAAAADARRAQLERTAVPVLQEVARVAASRGPVDVDLRVRCEELSMLLRDELRAAALVDDDVRVAVAAARRRGCQVTLVDDAGDADHEPLLPAVRQLVVAAATALSSGSLTVRRPPEGDVVVTLVVDGDAAAVAAVAAAMETEVARHGLTGLDVETVFEGDASEVFAELRARASDGTDGVPGHGHLAESPA